MRVKWAALAGSGLLLAVILIFGLYFLKYRAVDGSDDSPPASNQNNSQPPEESVTPDIHTGALPHVTCTVGDTPATTPPSATSIPNQATSAGADKPVAVETPPEDNLTNQADYYVETPVPWAPLRKFDLEMTSRFNERLKFIPPKDYKAPIPSNMMQEHLKQVSLQSIAQQKQIQAQIKQAEIDHLFFRPTLSNLYATGAAILPRVVALQGISIEHVLLNVMFKLYQKLLDDFYEGKIGRKSLERKAAEFFFIGSSAGVYFETYESILHSIEKALLAEVILAQPENVTYEFDISLHPLYTQLQAFVKEFADVSDPKPINVVQELTRWNGHLNLENKSKFLLKLALKYIYLPDFFAAVDKVSPDDPYPEMSSRTLLVGSRFNRLLDSYQWSFLEAFLTELAEKGRNAVVYFWAGRCEPESANKWLLDYMKTGIVPKPVQDSLLSVRKIAENRKQPAVIHLIDSHASILNSLK